MKFFATTAAFLTLSIPLTASVVEAQITPHPREMGLATPESPRPNPNDFAGALSNDLVTYVVTDHSVPLVTLTAFIGVGFVDGNEGAAEIWAQAMRSGGPSSVSAESFQAQLQAMVADYSVTLNAEVIEIRLDVPAEDAAAAAALFVAMLVEGPAIHAESIQARGRKAIQDEARSAEAGLPLFEGTLDGAVGLFNQHILGETTYGHTLSAADWSTLTTDHVARFQSEFFTGRNIVVGVGGDFDEAWATQALSGLSALPKGRRTNRRKQTAPETSAGRLIMTFPVDKLQGWIVMGHELPVVSEKDAPALEVMNYILGGGHFDTRLFEATRDARGLTNDDSGFIEGHRNGSGTYTLRTYGRPETVRLLIELTLQEVDRMRTELVTDEELFVAHGALSEGEFAILYRDGWAIARSLAEEKLIHGDHDWSKDYQKRIRAVTAEDVRKAAQKFMHPDRMDMVIVGPIEAIEAAPALEGEGALADYGTLVRGGN